VARIFDKSIKNFLALSGPYKFLNSKYSCFVSGAGMSHTKSSRRSFGYGGITVNYRVVREGRYNENLNVVLDPADAENIRNLGADLSQLENIRHVHAWRVVKRVLKSIPS
jgi:hypothetical protein